MGEIRVNGTRAMVDALLADPWGPARTRARAGQRVVGLLGRDIPVELVIAAGAWPLELAASAEPDAPTPNADRFLESSFSPVARSVAEQWLSGACEFLDTVIFSRADDSAQRLYYYVCELQRRGLVAGPRPLLYDLAKIPRASSTRHTLAATRRLARELGTQLQMLPEAIGARNRRRESFRAIERLRASERPPRGGEVQRLLRASDIDSGEPFDDALSGWIDVMRSDAGSSDGAGAGPRVLLVGSAPPDERLHAAIDRAGGCVVGELGDHSPSRLGDPVAIGGTDGPIGALSNHYHSLEVGPRAFNDRARALTALAERTSADAAIVWLIEEDESMAWDVPPIERALGSRGMPHLTLARRGWRCRDGALEAVADFVHRLGAAEESRP